MANQLFQRLNVGSDRFFQRIGCRDTLVRYGNSQVVTPTPLITRLGVTPTADITELSSESTNGWQVRLALPVLEEMFGEEWQSALQPGNKNWWVNEDDRGWKQCRVEGQYDSIDTGLFSIKLKILGAESQFGGAPLTPYPNY